jgi:hypothetical protein
MGTKDAVAAIELAKAHDEQVEEKSSASGSNVDVNDDASQDWTEKEERAIVYVCPPIFLTEEPNQGKQS